MTTGASMHLSASIVVHILVLGSLRLVVTRQVLKLLLLHEVKRWLQTSLACELPKLVGPTVRSNHIAAVHVRTVFVVVIPTFSFQLLVHANSHRVLTTVASKLHMMDVHVAL